MSNSGHQRGWYLQGRLCTHLVHPDLHFAHTPHSTQCHRLKEGQRKGEGREEEIGRDREREGGERKFNMYLYYISNSWQREHKQIQYLGDITKY